jgi:Flp pilus assembly protein TadG
MMRKVEAHRLKRIAGDEQGAAAVEFALILPLLLLLFLGTIEASSLITVDRRVNIVSGTVGDLVARTDPTEPLEVADLNDYFEASEGIIFPYEPGDLQQVVTVIVVDDEGNATVHWSCGYNGGVALDAGDPYTPPASVESYWDVMKFVAQPPPDESGYVVASESRYSYLPLLGMVFTEGLNLHRTSYYLPRYQGAIASPGAC